MLKDKKIVIGITGSIAAYKIPQLIRLLIKAKAVVQDIKLYEQNLESMALLKILAQSNESIRKGKFKPIANAFSDLDSKINEN